MTFALVLAVAAVSGFLGLSYEIVWVRLYSFVTGGTSSSFGVLLGAYLAGLAAGSLASLPACSDRAAIGDRRRLALPAALLLLGSVAAFALVPALEGAVRGPGFPRTLPLVALVTALMGAVLPLVCHFGISPDSRAGARLSVVYLANIVGSVAGSLLTGFVLLDRLPIAVVCRLLALAGIGLAALLFGFTGSARAALPGWAAAALALFCVARVQPLYAHLYEVLQLKTKYTPGRRFPFVLENRSGVITVDEEHVVSGGGVYDGVVSVDLVDDRNGIVRPFAVSALHPRPRRVLTVGLGSGSWAQVLANNPEIEHLTVVEINPGYLRLVAEEPATRSLLTNPKVSIQIDDARRWLKAHPAEKFDVVVQNVSWHWRAHAADLLSREYLEEVRAHLAPGGVNFYNATWSLDATTTGCTVHRYGFRFYGAIAVSDAPIALDRERWRAVLSAYRIDGRPVFDLSKPEHRKRLEEIVHVGEPGPRSVGGRTRELEPCASVLRWSNGAEVVTDDNMVTEWYRPWWKVP